MKLRAIPCTFALLLACGLEKGGSADGTSGSEGGATSSTGDPQTTGTGDPTTGATTSTDTGTDDGTASSVSISTGETGATGATGDTGDTGGTGDLRPGECRSNEDCSDEMSESCFAPGQSNCGACQVPLAPCMFDESCDVGFVCIPFVADCACSNDEGECVPVCEGDSCGPGATCDAVTGRCEPLTCSQDGVTCMPLFACEPGSGGDECQRMTCETDAQCGGMPCVEGGCFESFGVCQLPAP